MITRLLVVFVLFSGTSAYCAQELAYFFMVQSTRGSYYSEEAETIHCAVLKPTTLFPSDVVLESGVYNEQTLLDIQNEDNDLTIRCSLSSNTRALLHSSHGYLQIDNVKRMYPGYHESFNYRPFGDVFSFWEWDYDDIYVLPFELTADQITSISSLLYDSHEDCDYVDKRFFPQKTDIFTFFKRGFKLGLGDSDFAGNYGIGIAYYMPLQICSELVNFIRIVPVDERHPLFIR